MFDRNILYEDEEIIVIDKEPYFPVQSKTVTKRDCISELKGLFRERDGVKDEPYVGLIHRLDEPVEGIMVFAKNQKAASVLSGELQRGGFSKEYTAAVCPLSDDLPTSADLSDHILTDKKTNISRIVPEGTKGAKRAELRYDVTEEFTKEAGKNIRLLRVLLNTGRHHQIRVQLSNAKMPIVGDRKYGKELLSLPLCLAATALSFTHPVTGKRLEYTIRPQFLEKI
ncbi:MAG: RluA family pseudouridine synthase [Lachnospiraceae bacterium]|nr:RluA family pseudouridine synthase [Lachnospiraceae bacterium]